MSQQTTFKTIDFLYNFWVRLRFSTGLGNCMNLQFYIWCLRLCKRNR